ncbi:hypothetical protein [Agrococcus sediminis]|uniref:hypothetical protein n=1 Tax=Agrococcus sediminis TaxID=2599924 RepID=UPI0034299C93
MSATDATGTPSRRARDFRLAVGAGFGALGLPVQTRTDRFRPADSASDFEAAELADWTLTTAVARGDRLGQALDEAEALARVAGRPLAAVVHRRVGAEPTRAHVSMSLATFAALIRGRAVSREEGRRLRAIASTPPPGWR